MNTIITVLITFSFFLTINAHAQIIECRVKGDPSTAIQLAKFKFDKLRSSNGTIYKKASVSSKYKTTTFFAATELGNEAFTLFNDSEFANGVEVFFGTLNVEFINGIKKEMEIFCVDSIQMNQYLVQMGQKQRAITIKDW